MTATFWPYTPPAIPPVVPPVLAEACKSFEAFYFSRHSGRRLTWLTSMGSADVRAAFKSRSHDLNVSTYAIMILLLFENIGDDDFLTYSVRALPLSRTCLLSHFYTGNQRGYPHRRSRLKAQSPVSRLREVQGPQEAPTWTRYQQRRLFLIQR